MPKLIDLTGKRFGKWTVLYRTASSRNGATMWMCRCECGVEKDVYGSHLTYGKSNGCLQCSKLKGENHPQWDGVGKISGDYWCSLVRGANGAKGRKPVELTITKEFIWELFNKQDGKCALTGMPLTIDYRGSNHTASLDRIDSSKGYTEENVQWIHKHVNLMKNKLDQGYFVDLCSKVAAHNTKNK